MSEWKEYKVEDIISEISMGPFGSDVKKDVYTSFGVPILNGSNLQGFKLKEDSFGYVSEEKANSLKKCNAYRGDIVVTHRGTLGQIVYIPNNSKFDRYVISQSQFRFTCNNDIVRPDLKNQYLNRLFFLWNQGYLLVLDRLNQFSSSSRFLLDLAHQLPLQNRLKERLK